LAVLIDSSVIIAFFNKRDKNHRRAVDLLKEAMTHNYGLIFTSDYVIDETVTYLLKRIRRADVAIRAGKFLLGNLEGFPDLFKIIFTNEDIFSRAWALFERLSKRGLSFTDCILLSIAKDYNLAIMTFDDDFSGLVSIIR